MRTHDGMSPASPKHEEFAEFTGGVYQLGTNIGDQAGFGGSWRLIGCLFEHGLVNWEVGVISWLQEPRLLADGRIHECEASGMAS